MSKLPRLLSSLIVLGSTLAAVEAFAAGPHGGGSMYHGGGGFVQHGGGYPMGNPYGGGNYGGWHHQGWNRPHYYTRYYYPPATTYAPAPTRYYLPAEYAGAPVGTFINYAGINYLSNGDGTMSPN